MWDRKFEIIFTVFVTALIIGSVILISLNTMNDSSVSPQTVSKSTSGSSGLQLILRTSGSNITQGKNISISLDVFNPGIFAENVNAHSNTWATYINEGFSEGPCNNRPYGLLITSGNVSVNDLSNVTPLRFYEPGGYLCPVLLEVNYYNFNPISSCAYISGSNNGIPNMERTSFSIELNVSGYWTGCNQSNAQFHTFTPGIYTVFGADGWGQISVLHFLVK